MRVRIFSTNGTVIKLFLHFSVIFSPSSPRIYAYNYNKNYNNTVRSHIYLHRRRFQSIVCDLMFQIIDARKSEHVRRTALLELNLETEVALRTLRARAQRKYLSFLVIELVILCNPVLFFFFLKKDLLEIRLNIALYRTIYVPIRPFMQASQHLKRPFFA